MATYYQGVPEIQPDGLQTLYLMNPGYVGYSDSPAPANMVLLNSTANMLNPMSQLNQQQHLVGIPIQPSAPSQDLNRSSSIHGSSQELSAIHGLVPPRHHYNLSTPTPSNNSMDLSSLLGLHRPSPVPSAQQGLSLSLSPHQPQFGGYRPQPEIPASMAGAEEVRVPVISRSASAVSNGVSGVQQSVFMGSKYLKVAQQLLDEVVYVGKPAKGTDSKNRVKPNIDEEHTDAGDAKRGVELTTAERQELQMKKAKLVRVLDEVEQRYRQYHQQMQIVVSSFEAAAGFGSARTYTALALQTISKQFRCLRDAISGQIRATSKSLGEEDCLGVTKSHDSRLRFVDHHLRQQRALQQLGMIQHNAWRPQRGLPERAVSVLRAWLFEHFLHPYPKDSDKLMLAKQTGLTRSQVSNWFINARVRLWKPMVEEMYMEETKEQEQSNLGEKTSKSDANEDSTSKSSARQENSPTETEQTHPRLPTIAVTNNGSYDNDDETLLRPKTKKARSGDSLHLRTMNHSMTTNGELKSNGRNNQEILMNFGNNGGGFGGYSIGEIGRFDHQQFTPRLLGNGVSLTLGLPHCESLSLSGAQPSYISSERIQMSSEGNDYCSSSSLNNIPPVSHPSNSYEDHINIQRRKRFAAQLLPDFVA